MNLTRCDPDICGLWDSKKRACMFYRSGYCFTLEEIQDNLFISGVAL